ncbi:MAG: diguanylate cyclase [Deltaproteobacteria bacterium]|nr:diguanylate cyclase [Deltaproteobacteria bacterium]
MKPRAGTKKKSPSSVAAAQIIETALKEDCTVSELARLAQSDPAFALRVLAMVNSPAFALNRKVSSMSQAITLLGIRGLRNLALSLVAADLIPEGDIGSALLSACLRRALACRALATALNDRDPDIYFTSGLFLECGILVGADGQLTELSDIIQSPSISRVVRERAAGRDPHPISGAVLARDYLLPDETVEAIAKHHDPSIPESRVAAVAWVAERIAGVFEGGEVIQNSDIGRAAASKLGLSAQAADTIIRDLPDQVARAAEALQRDVGQQRDFESLMLDANIQLVQLNAQFHSMVRDLEAVISEKEILAEELRQANEKLQVVAATDSLTGLPNKRAFSENLTRELARSARHQEPLSLVVLDIDHFKKFNDNWGHTVGDAALRTVAQVLRSHLRAGDFPSRYGGEEFAIILPQTDRAGGVVVADRIRAALEATVIAGVQTPMRLTASFGLSTIETGKPRKSGADLFEQADSALYRAKRAGRNRVEVSNV